MAMKSQMFQTKKLGIREWSRYNKLQEGRKRELDQAENSGMSQKEVSEMVKRINREYDLEMISLSKETRNPLLYAEIIR